MAEDQRVNSREVDSGLTHLISPHLTALSLEVQAYLQEFRRQYSAGDVIDGLRSLQDLKVLVVGDAIVDEYHFCRPYGMASKSSTIAAQFLGSEAYAGGALAVANHLAGFCRRVDLASCLGEQDSREAFIRQRLKPNVSPHFFFRADASTVIKRRYVQRYLTTKLFEVSFFNDQPLAPAADEMFCQHLSRVLGEYDLVVVADFGHGLIGPRATDVLCQRARYLAVNAQLNSINYGYNVITKYSRMDYVCIDEEETRMASRDRYGPLEVIIRELAQQLGCRLMTVTRGHHGSVTYQIGAGFASVPVLSPEVVDTLGAGDAYLAVTAPCACKGHPAPFVGFVGNAVGALAVRIVGNQESVEPGALFSFVEALLE